MQNLNYVMAHWLVGEGITSKLKIDLQGDLLIEDGLGRPMGSSEASGLSGIDGE